MKYLFLVIILSFLIIGCNNQKKSEKQKLFKSFDFSYNDVFSTCFSIKFTQSDTVFIRQHFASIFSDTPKSNTNYYSLLTNIERTKLDSFMSHTNWFRFDSLYFQSYQDGLDYQFYIDYDSTKRLIHIHSDSVPLSLESFMIWIVNTKKSLVLHQIDSTINFESTKEILAPKMPSPLIKFKTPKIE